VYSIARLGFAPSRVWLSSFVAASYDRIPDMGGREAANLMWAAATMDWLPPLKYAGRLVARARDLMPVFNAQDLSSCLFAGGWVGGWVGGGGGGGGAGAMVVHGSQP
jgi:hypothetical protein